MSPIKKSGIFFMDLPSKALGGNKGRGRKAIAGKVPEKYDLNWKILVCSLEAEF